MGMFIPLFLLPLAWVRVLSCRNLAPSADLRPPLLSAAFCFDFLQWTASISTLKGLTHFDSLLYVYAQKSNHCAYICGGSFHLELFKTKGKALPLLFTIYAVRLNSLAPRSWNSKTPTILRSKSRAYAIRSSLVLKIEGEGESIFVFGSQ